MDRHYIVVNSIPELLFSEPVKCFAEARKITTHTLVCCNYLPDLGFAMTDMSNYVSGYRFFTLKCTLCEGSRAGSLLPETNPTSSDIKDAPFILKSIFYFLVRFESPELYLLCI